MSVSARIFPGILLLLLLFIFIIIPHFYLTITAPTRPTPVQHYEMVPLVRLDNGMFAVQVAVGTPGQLVRAIVDTGASLSWVVDVSCRGEQGVEGRYDPHASGTHKSLNRMLYKHYRTGEWIRAAVSTDCLAIGSLHITAVHLGRVTETNCDAHSSALLAISPRHYEGSVLDRIKQAKRLRFATLQWVNHEDGCSSSLCFGVDPRRDCDSIVVSCIRSRWIAQVSVSAVTDSAAVAVPDTDALIDTASTHIFLPESLVNLVRRHPLVHFDRRTERATYTGTPDALPTLPTFTVTINGRQVPVPPSVYIDAHSNEVLLACLKTTFASAPYTAILGLPFITRCCASVLFDFGRLEVGFIFK